MESNSAGGFAKVTTLTHISEIIKREIEPGTSLLRPNVALNYTPLFSLLLKLYLIPHIKPLTLLFFTSTLCYAFGHLSLVSPVIRLSFFQPPLRTDGSKVTE